MLKNSSNLITSALKAVGGTLRRGQAIVKPEEIGQLAEKVSNSVAGESAGLMENDYIVFPKTEDELKAQLIGIYFTERQKKEKTPSIGLVVEVIRGGRVIALRLFAGPFTRGYRQLNAAGNGPGDDFIYPTGAPAEDFRQSMASMYDTWKLFLGKIVHVVARPTVKVWGLQNGAVMNEAGRFDDNQYEVRNQRIGEFEYVEASDVEGFTIEYAPEVPQENPKSTKK